MTESPKFSLSEAGREQLQALMTLSALGWRYVTRAEVDRQRRHRRTGVLLEDTLRTQLAALNRIRASGRTHAFSEGNIETGAVRRFRTSLGLPPITGGSLGLRSRLTSSNRSQILRYKTNSVGPIILTTDS